MRITVKGFRSAGAAMILDDLPGNGEAKAAASGIARFIGDDERLENRIRDLRRDAAAIILNADLSRAAAAFCSHPDCRIRRIVLERIIDDVVQGPVKLLAVQQHIARRKIQLRIQLHAEERADFALPCFSRFFAPDGG